MNRVTRTLVTEAIQGFLAEQLNKKLDPELKQLEKAKLTNDQEQVDQQDLAISELKGKYALDRWMDDAANRMAKQLKFGTHITKGVHPEAKGDNVSFTQSAEIIVELVGSHTVDDLALDANGNAAALPLAGFFNVRIGEYTLKALILAEHESLKGCFSTNEATSTCYQEQFKAALASEIKSPTTSGLNKQVLWPCDGVQSIKEDTYICLVPLHPSALVHHVFKKINGTRFSEENKLARDNRKKKSVEQAAYVSIKDLACVQLGGTKPQNISQLTSGQGGRNYLLPSLPPQVEKSRGFSLSKRQTTFFNNSLFYYCRLWFDELFAIIEQERNVVEVRILRKQALQLILERIFVIAKGIQQQYPIGWSRMYNLPLAQRLWLDPRLGELEGEEEFKEMRALMLWREEVENTFSLWVDQLIRKHCPQKADEFDDVEVREWCREIANKINASQRREEGIF